jgi:hypothetical protein
MFKSVDSCGLAGSKPRISMGKTDGFPVFLIPSGYVKIAIENDHL